MEAGASGGQGWAVNHNYNFTSKGALGGTWFAKLAGSYKVTPWYKVTLQGLYIGDTTKNGNTFGNALTSAGTRRDDNTIGIERDHHRLSGFDGNGVAVYRKGQEPARVLDLEDRLRTAEGGM
jgi:hypothetical protein